MYRFAPSPTGDMHIGDLRVALFNFICAKKNKERFSIRIADTDNKKNIEGKDIELLDILSLFGISGDDVVYQSHNLKFHQQLATKLLMDKNAFSCFCTPEQLDKDRQNAKEAKIEYKYNNRCTTLTDAQVMENENPFVVRIKKSDHDIHFADIIKGDIHFQTDEMDSFIILRVDKYPTYDFACSLDDMLMDVNVVIQGEDHISNTPKQILIREYLNYNKEIKYAHIPIILNDEGKKMSKDDEGSSVKWLLKEGFLPSAIINYLILIGNKTPTKIFNMDAAIEWFDLKNISKDPIKFDLKKLKEINCEHIKKANPLELAKYVGFSSEDVGELVKIYTEKNSTINEIKVKIDTIFAQKECSEFQKEFEILKNIIKDAPFFAEFDDFKEHLSSKSGLKEEKFFKPLRVILTGEQSGPDLSDIYPHIKNYLSEIAK